MYDYIVIGGGFAGLSAAVHLSSMGKSVQVLEASNKSGGRAYSFKDKFTGTTIDNGQHIMMGCYNETLRFLKLIGAENNLIFQDKLEVNFLFPQLHTVRLKAASKFYPFNLASALLKYKALSPLNRLRMLKFFHKLPLSSDRDLSRLSVYEWLEQENQNEDIRRAFWEILTAGALNTSIYKASAKVFRDILIEIFFKGNKASTIILPKEGLTETYCINAEKFIEERRGKVVTGEQVNKLIVQNGRLSAVITNKRTIKNFKAVVSSVPYYSLQRILPAAKLPADPGFNYSSILAVHIWLKANKLNDTFYGLIDSDIHWIFNRGTHLTLVKSDADSLMDKSKEDIFELVKRELFRYCFIEQDDITGYRIIKEKRATFIPSNEILNKRPGPLTAVNGLVIAGDWTNTGLPSTIESAVKSGRIAAEVLG